MRVREATEDDLPALVALLADEGAERALIEAMRVRAGRRGTGLGRLLLGHVIEAARERGCGLAQLTSNKRRTDAHRFYVANGFAATHEGFRLSL